jgi:hypothetical protein
VSAQRTESRGITPKVTLMSCRRSRGSGIAKKISREAAASGVVSVCQDQATALKNDSIDARLSSIG